MEEHGPLWKTQPGSDARPIMRSNGTVDYPWHAWLASKFGDYKLPMDSPLPPSEQKYDVWLA
jgi:aldos-2-ulose dehydratase